MKYDILIVGAGPAGAYTAYRLAQADLDVLLLEKEELPRYKPCGGGLTSKVFGIIPEFNLDHVIEDKISTVVFTHNVEAPIKLDFIEPFTYMTMRDKFDYFLVQQAKEVGVKVIDNTPVVDIRCMSDRVRVCTTGSEYTAKYIIGADGARSLVAQQLGLMDGVESAIAYEKEIKVSSQLLEAQRGIMNLDYGIIHGGYSWIFPKVDHFSVGVGTFAEGVSLKKSLEDYLAKGKIDDYKELKAKGHPLPVGGSKRELTYKRAVLIGDAAGLVDPLSGEGIFYALKSADLASRILLDVIRRGKSLSRYTTLINQEILPEFRKAELIKKIFFKFSDLLHKLFMKENWILKKLIQVIYGDDTYSNLYDNIQNQIPLLKF
ncbi:geranylgeranyl reductase family protein [Acetohalobium arabaticum]|uniref:Geranylgeranyl reductase n=1 Tax=Acetohalobium arabaticum (strain ATCC 49924 / DSM 5501 / Z-7288) TaxID=574087 RepID=D9QUR9_ACEAZ|nr:geranylgeranyl reductase family protein [Acetohalobium arabaticum]ADL11978.1 geranylgeranyl reductase [Acetohalobium arabaticum DSM 5501]